MMILALAGLLLAALPALMFLANRRLFTPAPPILASASTKLPRVSVLIPARNEEAGIQQSVTAALASEHVQLEIIVLDDQSTDATRSMVESISAQDARVRCESSRPLPPGWNGKQFACKQLSELASYDLMLFIDADVRLEPHAIARLAQYRDAHSVDLLSAFPRQVTNTWLEKWLIPMMHYLLLGYLPFARMRSSTDPSLAAGCGQLFFTTRTAYEKSGTHAAIAESRHDGIKLPRSYRRAGLVTDVVDGTDLASCRMYSNAPQVVRGLLKNASEGIAQPKLIVVFSILLLGGSVLPMATLLASLLSNDWDNHYLIIAISLAGIVLGHLPRALGAMQFRQSISGVVFHSVATLTFVILQWIAFVMSLLGRQVAWRGRTEVDNRQASPTT